MQMFLCADIKKNLMATNERQNAMPKIYRLEWLLLFHRFSIIYLSMTATHVLVAKNEDVDVIIRRAIPFIRSMARSVY